MSPKVPFDEPTEKELHDASEHSRLRHHARVTYNVELEAFDPRRSPFFVKTGRGAHMMAMEIGTILI